MTKLYVDLLQAFDEIGEITGNDELRQMVQDLLQDIDETTVRTDNDELRPPAIN